MKKGGRFERFRDRFLTPWWSRYFLIPAAAAAPTAVATFWFAINKDKPTYWLKGYEPWIFLFAAILTAILTAVRSWLNEIAAFTVTELKRGRDELARLLGWIRAVVTYKSRRFRDALTTLESSPDPIQLFLAITRPDLQIKQIVQAIHGFFQQDPDHGDDRVKVSLMQWDAAKRHLVFVEYYPDGERPRTPESIFRDTATVAGRAYFDRTTAICEDMRNDMSFTALSEREDGSLFAYPVIDGDAVAFVVNVVSRKPRRFLKTDKEALSTLMVVFGDRLVLEEELKQLRERVSTTGRGTP